MLALRRAAIKLLTARVQERPHESNAEHVLDRVKRLGAWLLLLLLLLLVDHHHAQRDQQIEIEDERLLDHAIVVQLARCIEKRVGEMCHGGRLHVVERLNSGKFRLLLVNHGQFDTVGGKRQLTRNNRTLV